MAAKYATYSDYAAFFPARATESIFDMYSPSAEAYIDVLTHNRAEQAEGYKRERVKQAACALINEMCALDGARGASGARVASVSNDGYSESYTSGSASADGETATLRQVAMRWLSGTGLVSAL